MSILLPRVQRAKDAQDSSHLDVHQLEETAASVSVAANLVANVGRLVVLHNVEQDRHQRRELAVGRYDVAGAARQMSQHVEDQQSVAQVRGVDQPPQNARHQLRQLRGHELGRNLAHSA